MRIKLNIQDVCFILVRYKW